MSKAKDTPKKPSAWEKTRVQCLVRHIPSGRYYLRARIGRKEAHREALKTDDFNIAQARLHARLKELRDTLPLKGDDAPKTLWEAVRKVMASVESDPSLKAASRSAYDDVLRSLKPGLVGGVPETPLLKLTAGEMEAWWKRNAAHYAPARANYNLMFVRRALKLARDASAIFRDPAAALEPMPVPRTRLKLITSDEFTKLVRQVRSRNDDLAERTADWIELSAYSGMRPEEVNSLRWEHIDRKRNVLTVVGGVEGTKNRLERRVPIMPQMAELLDRIAKARGCAPGAHVARVRDTTRRIQAACGELGMARMRRYDFRHLFATRCNESGIDIPTISRWLGHRDGGALVMRTYVHVHESHDQQSAAKVKF